MTDQPTQNDPIDPEVMDIARAFLIGMYELSTRKSEDCLRCGQPLTGIEKPGRSLYGVPCGCRLWQGEIPEAWK